MFRTCQQSWFRKTSVTSSTLNSKLMEYPVTWLSSVLVDSWTILSGLKLIFNSHPSLQIEIDAPVFRTDTRRYISDVERKSGSDLLQTICGSVTCETGKRGMTLLCMRGVCWHRYIFDEGIVSEENRMLSLMLSGTANRLVHQELRKRWSSFRSTYGSIIFVLEILLYFIVSRSFSCISSSECSSR